MITEDYVSFEVAQLLQEKGFKEPVTELNKLLFKEGEKPVLQITHQKAMKWLREVYNIDIIIFHEKLPNDCYWARIERDLFTEFQQEPNYKSYEESVEAALKYCLENLI